MRQRGNPIILRVRLASPYTTQATWSHVTGMTLTIPEDGWYIVSYVAQGDTNGNGYTHFNSLQIGGDEDIDFQSVQYANTARMYIHASATKTLFIKKGTEIKMIAEYDTGATDVERAYIEAVKIG